MDTKYIDAVYADERVKMISFTGSAEVGWNIKALANKKICAVVSGGNVDAEIYRQIMAS